MGEMGKIARQGRFAVHGDAVEELTGTRRQHEHQRQGKTNRQIAQSHHHQGRDCSGDSGERMAKTAFARRGALALGRAGEDG